MKASGAREREGKLVRKDSQSAWQGVTLGVWHSQRPALLGNPLRVETHIGVGYILATNLCAITIPHTWPFPLLLPISHPSRGEHVEKRVNEPDGYNRPAMNTTKLAVYSNDARIVARRNVRFVHYKLAIPFLAPMKYLNWLLTRACSASHADTSYVHARGRRNDTLFHLNVVTYLISIHDRNYMSPLSFSAISLPGNISPRGNLN